MCPSLLRQGRQKKQSTRQWIGMNGHVLHHDFLLRPALGIHLDGFQLSQHLVAANDPAEYRVLAVQMRRRRKADEELAAVRQRAFVRHAHDAARVVPQARPDLVFESLLPDRGGRFR